MHGYRVYRYRNIYSAYHRDYHGNPESLGIKVLSSLRHPDAITNLKQQLGGQLDEWKDCGSIESCEGDVTISATRPRYGVPDAFYIYIYEIDLDHNIFHINGIPLFDLECLPSEEHFLKYVNHFDENLCFMQELPSEHKYKMPPPPTVTDSDLAMYRSSVRTGTHMALSDLLAAGDILSPPEQVRVTLFETMVRQCMAKEYIVPIFYRIQLANDHNPRLTDDEWSVACSIADIVFAPQIFDERSRFIYNYKPNSTGFTWVREDTVLCIATRLDDERCLQASMSRLINAILEQKDPGDYFGVAFSVHHCAIIKVVKGEEAMTFSHTEALQFLPSYYGDSPCTPGIAALARLANHVDPTPSVRASKIDHRERVRVYYKGSTGGKGSIAQGADNTPPRNFSCPALPPELWQMIALHLHVRDLIMLGLVSRRCREVASMLLRYPHVCGYRLVGFSEEKLQCLLRPRAFLRPAIFSAVQAGVPATVLVGCRLTRTKGSLWVHVPLCEHRDQYQLRVPFAARNTSEPLCLCHFCDERCYVRLPMQPAAEVGGHAHVTKSHTKSHRPVSKSARRSRVTTHRNFAYSCGQAKSSNFFGRLF